MESWFATQGLSAVGMPPRNAHACMAGITEEELDFIINYDIKYRMGDELNAE